MPVITSDADSLSPYWLAICTAPLSRNTRKKEIRSIIYGLNLASHETIIAVKPRPPAVLVEIVWLEPLTRRKPVSPHNAPEIAIVHIITLLTFIPAYLAVFSLSPTTAIS